MLTKIIWKRVLSHFSLFLLTILLFGSCNQDIDTSLKSDLTAKSMVERDFQGVNLTVKDAIISLSGTCPTQKAKDAVAEKVKNTYRVKDVINNITIGPVTIGTDDLLKHSIDSVMQYHAGAMAIVKDSNVSLQGNVPGDKQQALMDAINSLKPKSVVNQLSIQ